MPLEKQIFWQWHKGVKKTIGGLARNIIAAWRLGEKYNCGLASLRLGEK